jgi:hypothetical protein
LRDSFLKVCGEVPGSDEALEAPVVVGRRDPYAPWHGAQNTRVLIDPSTSPARHPRDLARIDQTRRRCAASAQVGRKTLNDTIRDEVSDPVDELRLSKRLLEPLALGAYACIVPSRLLRAPGHVRTLPDG